MLSLSFRLPCKKEAREVVAEVDKVKLEDNSKMKPMARKRWEQPIAGGMTLAGLSYQMFDGGDYDDFQNRYLRARYGWALDDLGKRGLKRITCSECNALCTDNGAIGT